MNYNDYQIKTFREYMDVLKEESKTTSCLRKGVGVMVVDNLSGFIRQQNRFYNGPCGKSKCKNIIGRCGCMHAEIRAVLWSIDYGLTPKQQLLLSTYSPCQNCANAIIESKLFIAVVFDILTVYPDGSGSDGVNALIENGIDCQCLTDLESKNDLSTKRL